MKNAEAKTTDKAATVAAQGAPGAPEKASSKKAATQKKGAPTGQKAAKGKAKSAKPKKEGKTAKAPRAKATGPRPESKGAKVLEMIARAKGATLAEIMKATKWQAHTVRGFISIASKKHSMKIESDKRADGERVYSVAR